MDNVKLHYRDGAVVLYKRGKSNKWQARLKVGTGSKGWKRISTGEYDVEKASQIACKAYDKHQFRLEEGFTADTKSFSQVAEIAIQEMLDDIEDGNGKKSYQNYILIIKRYFIPFFKDTHIDTIDHQMLKKQNKYRNDILKEKFSIKDENGNKIQKNTLPSKSTINNHSVALRRVFNVAIERGWINEKQVPIISNTGEARKTTRRPYFTPEEYRILYRFMRQWCHTGRKEITRNLRELLRDYVLIAANTGMRTGTETDNLKWNDISTMLLNGNHYLKIIVNGKTGERELIARRSTKKYLKRIASNFPELKDLTEEELFRVNDYVFRLKDGSRPKKLNNTFKQCLAACNLLNDTQGKRRTLYSLRHTYATYSLLNKIPIHLLAKQMGTSVAMLERHYSHVIPSLAAETLAGEYYGRRKNK